MHFNCTESLWLLRYNTNNAKQFSCIFELNRSMTKESYYRNLYDFYWVEKIYALVRKHELLILVLQRLSTLRALQGSSPTLKKNVRGNGHSSIPVARESFRLHLSHLTHGPLYGYAERCTTITNAFNDVIS